MSRDNASTSRIRVYPYLEEGDGPVEASCHYDLSRGVELDCGQPVV